MAVRTLPFVSLVLAALAGCVREHAAPAPSPAPTPSILKSEVSSLTSPLAAPVAEAAAGGDELIVSKMHSRQNLFGDAAKVLTLAHLESLNPGMTYDEVLAALEIPEGPARFEDMKYVKPDADVQLTWFGGPEDKTSITVFLTGRKVTDKAQVRLK